MRNLSISKVNERIHNLIDEIQISLFEQALDFMNSNIFEEKKRKDKE